MMRRSAVSRSHAKDHGCDLRRKHNDVALSRVIGSRMRQARDLCGYSQMRAAELLGYKNSSRLAKIENGQAKTVPLNIIITASRLYEVSVDFLLGLSSDWEVGLGSMVSGLAESREFGPWLLDHWETVRNRDMAVLIRLYDEFAKVKNVASNQIRTALDVTGALERFMELNKGFEDMRGSNRLLMVARRLADQAKAGSGVMSRFTLQCQEASKSGRDSRQLTLPIEPEAYDGQ